MSSSQSSRSPIASVTTHIRSGYLSTCVFAKVTTSTSSVYQVSRCNCCAKLCVMAEIEEPVSSNMVVCMPFTKPQIMATDSSLSSKLEFGVYSRLLDLNQLSHSLSIAWYGSAVFLLRKFVSSESLTELLLPEHTLAVEWYVRQSLHSTDSSSCSPRPLTRKLIWAEDCCRQTRPPAVVCLQSSNLQ